MTNRHISAFFGFLALICLGFSTAAAAQNGPRREGLDFVIGAPNAPVTLIEYASMTCSHCAAFHHEVYPTLKKNFIDTGSKLDSRVKAELIYSIFLPSSPIHDGAVILTDGRIAAAGCFLPLSKDPNIDKRYGTRHRAALGLTEDSDAIVVLVSEEAGEAHLVKNGRLTTNLSEQELRQSLGALLDLPRGQVNLPRRVRGWLQSQGSERK